MDLKSLQEIFNEKIFRVPDYQRGYSWDGQQLRDLWRDIDILENGKDHYTGMLSVVGQDEISIVDGQQRITTLIILIQVICNCEQVQGKEWINGKEKKDYVKKYLHRQIGSQGEITKSIFGYKEDNPSYVYFKKHILELEDMDASAPSRTLYTQKLKTAKEFFEEKIKSMNFKEIELLLFKITEQLKFNYYLIDSELNEFVAFETMNNRGKPLSSLELLKNRLIYLSTLLKDNDDKEKKSLRKDINNAWKTVYEYLGKNPDPKKVLNDDEFLKNHWIMSFRYDRNTSKIYRDFLLNKHFTAEQVSFGEIKHGHIREYAHDIQRAVKAYYYMHNPKDSEYSEEMQVWLLKLNQLGFGAFKPLITSMLVHDIEEEQSIKILKFAERFLFVASNIEFRQANYRNATFYHYARDCHKSPANFEGILVDNNIPNVNSYFSEDKFCQRVHENDENFYSWKGLRYFLYEYELELKKRADGEMKVQWENVNAESIEHIFPQNPNQGEWNCFKDEKSLLNNIGNLLLLSLKKNSKLQNKPFAEKKQTFREGSYSAIKVSECNDWIPESIKDRQKKMFDFMMSRWNLTRKESKNE